MDSLREDVTALLRERQLARERQQRQAALGRRISAAQDGSLGPVIKRWINASVEPVSQRLQLAASFYLAQDYPAFCSVLDSPIFELQAALNDGDGNRSAINPIFYWLTRGTGEYAGDMVLAALGCAISMLASSDIGYRSRGIHAHRGPSGVFLTATLSAMGDAARETCLGQFLTQVQGAEAMERVRRKDRSSWAQRDKMDAVAALLFGQVLPQLVSEERGEVILDKIGTRSVVRVLRQTADGPIERRLSLRKPEKQDWELLEVARKVKGEADPYKQAWMTFALTVLCAAQAEHGWFDIGKSRKEKKQRGSRWTAWTLHLADEPAKAMQHDLERWIQMGFSNDPMIVAPESGDYLSVKHRQVVGRRGPMGIATSAEGTLAWNTACEVMGNTAWRVSRETLASINTGILWDVALKSVKGNEDALKTVLGAYAREASEEAIYMPLYMDFRGRVYPRTTWVTYQGTDVQKGLLRFAHADGFGGARDMPPLVYDAVALHAGGLWGNGMDKSPLSERKRWFKEHLMGASYKLDEPEEAIQFATFMNSYAPGLMLNTWNDVPCQIDGTCNGLQHLSALFRDELAAPFVNLNPSSYEEVPSDLYSKVADEVIYMMSRPVGSYEVGHSSAEINSNWRWISRSIGHYMVDRKTCKKPVMVLPYGGTFDAIEKAVVEAVLDQEPPPGVWQECKVRVFGAGLVDDAEAIAGGYLAFKDRPLKEHPLFLQDMKKLAMFVLEAIKKAIPRAMAAMDAFRDIAGKIGERALEWATGPNPNDLWVVHAYPKSARSSLALRGFHLPNSIRGLALLNGKDEVDPRAHRTGIVANFIHSQDAAHLTRTMQRFRKHGGTSFAAIHDCFMSRPSDMPLLNESVRQAFEAQYAQDPLSLPVRLRDVHTGKVEEFKSWYFLAMHLGAHFPDQGKWMPWDVLKSAWFFS